MTKSLSLEEGRPFFGWFPGFKGLETRRAHHRLFAASRYVFAMADDVIRLFFSEMFQPDGSLVPTCSLLEWLLPFTSEKTDEEKRVRAIVFSERLRVHILCLGEREKAILSFSLEAVPRHQDRGNRDAGTDDGNSDEKMAHIAAGAAGNARFVNYHRMEEDIYDGKTNPGLFRQSDGR